jgi:hypothetical protein
VLRHINHSHAAFADFLQEFVPPNDGARALVQLRVDQNGLGLRRTVAGLQEIKFARVVESREQFVNPLAKFPILAAGPKEKTFPGLAREQRNRLFENLLFLFHRFTG